MVYGQVFQRPTPGDCFINVNVGGFRQRLEHSVLQRFPQTRLGRLLCCRSREAVLELCDDFVAAEMEFYFDRSPSFFCHVLNFYLTGKMHLVEGLCVVSFHQEIEYWGIKERHLDHCCSDKFQELLAADADGGWDDSSDEGPPQPLDSDSLAEDDEEQPSGRGDGTEAFQGSWCGAARRSVWVRLEQPGHSRSAKVMAVTSLGVVMASVVAMCVNSMPDFRRPETENWALSLFELFCVAFFSAEFLLRLCVAPSVTGFLRGPLNLIDLASVLPFYVTALCDAAAEGESPELENVGKVVQILRLMRVFRVLKLARHSAGLRSLGATLSHSIREVGQLVLFLSVGISLFSVLIYFVERDCRESSLHTVPAGWWWATISMTTVGYGDTLPVTLAGKLIGTLCIVSGLLIVALPITNIFNKFSKFYERQRRLGHRRRRRQQQQS